MQVVTIVGGGYHDYPKLALGTHKYLHTLSAYHYPTFFSSIYFFYECVLIFVFRE